MYKTSIFDHRIPGTPAAAVAVLALVLAATACTKEELPATHPVLLEAAAFSGTSPWTSSVTTPGALTDVSSEFSPVKFDTAAAVGPVPVSGDTPMLYGGSGGVSVCEESKLIAFLEQNPDKAAAFADVVGASDVRSFVESLAPVLLTHDTAVTNHGFENGEPTPFQSVLQAGTAVFVDKAGSPQVRCECGNPLRPPETSTYDQSNFIGAPWENFSIELITEVVPSPQALSQLTTVEVDTLEANVTPAPVAVSFKDEGVGKPISPTPSTEPEISGENLDTDENLNPDTGEGSPGGTKPSDPPGEEGNLEDIPNEGTFPEIPPSGDNSQNGTAENGSGNGENNGDSGNTGDGVDTGPAEGGTPNENPDVPVPGPVDQPEQVPTELPSN
ncbi:DUF6777 domain-containing protein [Rhodococcus aetherivorans]|uniref:DUF6777 domain-containing protein n=1 Tax=Rhodococcus aetherivorans TaxID=191292 RepID=UPI0036ACC312